MKTWILVSIALSLAGGEARRTAPVAHQGRKAKRSMHRRALLGGAPARELGREHRVVATPPPAPVAAPTPADTEAVAQLVRNPAVPMTPVAESVPQGPQLAEGDLDSLASHEPGASIVKLFKAGKYGEAQAAIAKKLPDGPGSRYLRALCLMHTGRDAEAAPLFEQLAVELPSLAPRCRFHAGVGREAQGAWALAQAQYAEVPEGAVLWAEAQFGLARVLRAQGDTLGALGVLAPIANRAPVSLGRDAAAEALNMSIGLLVELKENESEAIRSIGLKLWSEHPKSKLADEGLAAARRSGVKEPPLETRLVRAELLEEAQHNAEALALLEPIVKALPFPSPLGCTARFLQGKALRKERQLAKAVATLQPVIDKCGGEKNLRVRALYLAAQADGFRDTNEAVGFYKTLAHDYPDHGLADDALFFAADIEERAGDDDAAQKVLETLVDTPAYRDGDYRADGLFHLFWLLRSKGEWEKGLSVLERLSSEYGATRSAEAERAEYWRGKALIELKRPADAATVFDSLARSHPTSYYAMQARARLASIDPVKAKLLAADQAKRTPPAPLAFALGSLGGEPHLDAALALHRLGLEQDATDELMAIPNDRLRAEPDGMRLLVLLLSRMGQPAIAQQIARSTLAQQLAGPLTPETMQTWLAAFPLAFREPLQKACEKAKLEPDLFQALIREESALDPKALSWAGAVGLSQLMLPTAKEVASHLGMKASNITKDALVDPELNLTLGSTYIAGLLKRFNGNPALALAAYNAGPGSVNKWLGMNGQEDLDAFVEEIPVEETRHYVKRVLQSFNIYQLLYQQSAQATLPLSCVKG